MNKKHQGGFTLLELLIVISIIAILSVALIFVINPAETLKKSRDAQRISDLNTLKTAMGLYTTSTITPYLGGSASNAICKTGGAGGTWGTPLTMMIRYSYPNTTPGADISDLSLDGTTFTYAAGANQASSTMYTLTDGTGWLPVNFDSLTGGSPISNLPLDPVNDIVNASPASSASDVSNGGLVYRYACNSTSLTYEIDAVLESTAYTSDDNKMSKDGGNNSNYYEVGTNLKILGTGTDF